MVSAELACYDRLGLGLFIFCGVQVSDSCNMLQTKLHKNPCHCNGHLDNPKPTPGPRPAIKAQTGGDNCHFAKTGKLAA